MNKIFLETQRLILTEITRADTHLLLDLDSDPDVMRFLTDGKPSTVDENIATIDRIMTFIKRYNYRFGLWLAYTKDTNEFIGWFIFRPCKKNPDDLSQIELGYRLKKQFWKKGFATEGSQALLHYGFNQPEVKTIFATTMKLNIGSQNVMKKLGMQWKCDYQEDAFPGINKSAVRYEIQKTNKPCKI